jgi:carbamoyl-phosphate synthase (ammonia)
MLPAQNVSEYVLSRIESATQKIVERLNITGPFNIQYIAKDSDVMCIECNLRASRSFPFISKTMGVDFIEAATKLMVGAPVDDMNLPNIGTRNRPSEYVGVKAPMFSFTRLGGADPILGVEMASTGEVACFGADVHEAFIKAMMSTGFKLPKKRIAITVQAALLEEVVHHVHLLHSLGYEILATAETHPFLTAKNIPCTFVNYADSTDTGAPNIKQMISDDEVDMVVNLHTPTSTEVKNNYLTRRTAVDFGVPLLTNAQLFKMFAEALVKHKEGKFQFTKADSLFDFYEKEEEDKTWTNPKEFH